MKTIIFGLLVCLSMSAKAIIVTESLESEDDCYGIDIASHQPTALFAARSFTNGGTAVITSTDAFKYVWVQNIDTSTTTAVYCRPGNGVAVPTISTITATSQPNRGARVGGTYDMRFPLVPGRTMYCQGNSVTAVLPITVCRGK